MRLKPDEADQQVLLLSAARMPAGRMPMNMQPEPEHPAKLVALAAFVNLVPWIVLIPSIEPQLTVAWVYVWAFFAVGAMMWVFEHTFSRDPRSVPVYASYVIVYYLAIIGWLNALNLTASATISNCFAPAVHWYDSLPLTVSILTAQGTGGVTPVALACKYLVMAEQLLATVLLVVVLATAANTIAARRTKNGAE
jgi:hypothetical protein